MNVDFGLNTVCNCYNGMILIYLRIVACGPVDRQRSRHQQVDNGHYMATARKQK